MVLKEDDSINELNLRFQKSSPHSTISTVFQAAFLEHERKKKQNHISFVNHAFLHSLLEFGAFFGAW